MRARSKVVEIPATATVAQMENGFDNQLANGWKLLAIFPLGTKTYAVFVKVVSR